MAEKKSRAKKCCREALESAEQTLLKLPKVVGLGIVRSPADQGHRVAVYVSEFPENAKEREALPKTLPVPQTDKQVDVEILEIGKVEKEESLPDEGPGKEPM